MSFATINGNRIALCDILIPYYGLWVADVSLADAAPLTESVEIVIANLTMKGHVYRSSSFSGSKSARVVAGTGGMRKTVEPQSYNNPFGVQRSMILRDVAAAVGEQVQVSGDTTLGPSWVRERCTASEVFRLLLGEQWYASNDGVIQTSDRSDQSIIKTPFTVVGWSGAKGKYEIATEDLASWIPGRTFQGNNIETVQKISSTAIMMNNEGKLRLDVLTTGAEDV